MMIRLVAAILLCAVTSSATTYRGMIGEEDLNIYGGSGSTTFSRRTSTGGTVTMTKIGAGSTYLDWLLKTDLASTASGKGADLVGNTRKVFNVNDYATPQAAYAAASANDTLYFPAGTHAIASQLAVAKALTLEFEQGAVLTPSAGYTDNAAIYVTASNVKIRNPQIDGTNLPPLGAVYNGTQSEKGLGILVFGTNGAELTGIEITGGKVENTPFSGIMLEECISPLVQGVTVDTCSTEVADTPPGVIYFLNCDYPRAFGNHVNAPGLKGISASGRLGARFHGNVIRDGVTAGHAGLFAANTSGFDISGNYVTGMVGLKVDRGNGAWSIANNTFESVEEGIIVQGGYGGAIIGNTIREASEDGIYLGGDPTNTVDLTDIVVQGNTIYRTGTPTSSQDGIQIYSATADGATKRITVTENKINNAYYGIRVRVGTGADFQDIEILDNTVQTTQTDAIYLAGQNVRCEGNVVRTAGANAITVAGLSGATATGEVVIRGNRLSGVTTYGTQVLSSVVAKKFVWSENEIQTSTAALIYSGANVARLDAQRNSTTTSTNTSTVSITSHATTALVAHVDDNQIDKRLNWSDGGGGITGTCRFNEMGTAMTTAPAGVVCADYGSGAPAITRPLGSVYHRYDSTAGGPNLYIRQRNAGDTADEWTAH